MADERTELGLSLEEGLKEALAWKRGEIALETVNLDPMRGRDAEGPYQAGSAFGARYRRRAPSCLRYTLHSRANASGFRKDDSLIERGNSWSARHTA